jgi:hypothetical protein
LVTFGTSHALLKCIKASGKKKNFEEKEQSDESQNQHKGRQRTVGQLSSEDLPGRQSRVTKRPSKEKS